MGASPWPGTLAFDNARPLCSLCAAGMEGGWRARPPRRSPRRSSRIMAVTWSPDELESNRQGRRAAHRHQPHRWDTAPKGGDMGCLSANGQVYVRTWYRRDNGWFGHAVESRRARISVPGLEVDIAIEDVGKDEAELRASVDAAYRAKYGRYGETTVKHMVTDDAAATTLRLVPEQGARPGLPRLTAVLERAPAAPAVYCDQGADTAAAAPRPGVRGVGCRSRSVRRSCGRPGRGRG